jgi:hypothetical protein
MFQVEEANVFPSLVICRYVCSPQSDFVVLDIEREIAVEDVPGSVLQCPSLQINISLASSKS